MHTDAATTVADRRPKRRRNLTRRRLDGRTRTAKRARQLREHYQAVLTADGRALTIELAARVTKASELVALAEDMRANMLRGAADVCADDLVRMQRLADASVRQLGITTWTKPQPTTLEEYLAKREGEA
jgi:hypothetical protein